MEREVIKEVQVRVGITEEEMEEINRKASREKEVLMKQAQDDMKALIEQQSRTEQEREELQAAFAKEAEDRKKIEDQKGILAAKLKVGLIWSHDFHSSVLFLVSKWRRSSSREVR